jgi:type III secretory pathway component EscV
MAGNQLARWTGAVLVSLNLIGQMFLIPGYPFWSLMIIAVDVVALYALCVYGGRGNVAAA